MREIEVFDIKIHPLKRSEFASIIESGLKNGSQIVQNGVNAASISALVKDDRLRQALNNSDLVNIDGMSVVWALRFFGYENIPERVACPDLANEILKLADKNNYTVFLFGAEKACLGLCKKQLQNTFKNLKIVGYRHGFYNKEDEPSIIAMINKVKPDILLIGMPSPKKEFFVEKYRDELSVKYILGVGGLFDILSGMKKRAPLWMQNLGIEWFYRFIQEPLRLWKRYSIGNIEFIWLVFREKLRRLRSEEKSETTRR
jgi:N-acetylglucosaminyldiphosphoundecaprenol N-acetyl-beta-D-mannosaminyltransferase